MIHMVRNFMVMLWGLTICCAGCAKDDDSDPSSAPEAAITQRGVDPDSVTSADVRWDVSDVEPWFKVVSPPRFDSAANGFVMIVEAKEDGLCAVAPAVPSGFFGFEAILFDEDDVEIHLANDVGSATRSPAPMAKYGEPSVKRICVDPPRWSAGTRVRLTIAPGIDAALVARVRRGRVSAI